MNKKFISFISFTFLFVCLNGCSNQEPIPFDEPVETTMIEEKLDTIEPGEKPVEKIILEESDAIENFDYNIFKDFYDSYPENMRGRSDSIPSWRICHKIDAMIGYNDFASFPSGVYEEDKDKIRFYYLCDYDKYSDYEGYYPALILVENIWTINTDFPIDYENGAKGKFSYIPDNLDNLQTDWDNLIELARQEYGDSYSVNDLINNGYTNEQNPIHILSLKDFKSEDGTLNIHGELLDYSYGYDEKNDQHNYFSFSKQRMEEIFNIDVKDNYILAVWIEAYYIPEENKYYISTTPCPMFYQK